MKRFTMFACLTMALMFALGSFAGDIPQPMRESATYVGDLEMSRSDMSSSANRDTVYLIGPHLSGALVNGQFRFAAPGLGRVAGRHQPPLPVPRIGVGSGVRRRRMFSA